MRRGRHNACNVARLPLRGVAGFPVEEEERLVFAVIDLRQHDGSADVGAELVAVQAGGGDACAAMAS